MNPHTSIFSQDSAASPSLPEPTASGLSQCAKSNPTADISSPPTGQASKSTTTRRRSTAGAGKESGLSPGAHLANPLPLPGSNEARQITAGSGRKLSESLESAGPLGSCLKILLESNQWDSTECLLTWKRAATKSGRSIYQLAPSIPRNAESASGLWATARAEDSQQTGAHRGKADTLTSQARIALWPTARASNAGPDYAIKDRPDSGGESLVTKLAAAMWPTPQVCQAPNMSENRGKDHGGARLRITPQTIPALWPAACAMDSQQAGAPGKSFLTPVLREAFGAMPSGLNAETASGGAPNPEFVAWLMGLPWDYLKHWETQSSGQLPLL